MLKSTLSAAAILLCCLFGNNVNAQYCAGIATASCNGGTDYIDSLTIIGDNSYIYSFGCNGNPGNYSYNSSQALNIAQGGVIDFLVIPYSNTVYFAAALSIWVDWNGDGDFYDVDEEAFVNQAIPSGSVGTPWITVPNSATVGITRMRLRTYAAGGASIGACDTVVNGETEDYLVNITPAVGPCTGMPSGGSAVASQATLCAPASVTLSALGASTGQGITYQWYEAPSGGASFTTIVGATGATYTTFLSTSTDFYVDVTCANSSQTMNSSIASVMMSTCDSVWPGDANADFVADNMDILQIAMASGATGTTRPNASTAWTGQYSADWNTSSLLVNDKFADCNGDGVVDTTDGQAVLQNYGLTHMRPAYLPNVYKTTSFPDLKIDATGVQMIPGTTVQIPVVFGSTSTPAQNIYGLAGTVEITGITPTANPSMTFTNWMGTPAVIKLAKATSTNDIDFAIARMDHNNATGNGVLGYLQVALPITATGDIVFHLSDVSVIDNMGLQVTDINVVDDTATVVPTSIAAQAGNMSFANIYPNPSKTTATVAFSLQQASDVTVRVTDITGRVASAITVKALAGLQNIELPHVVAGIYTVSITDIRTGGTKMLKWIKE